MVAGMIWDPDILVLMDWDPGYSESYQYSAMNQVACFWLHPCKLFEYPDLHYVCLLQGRRTYR